MHKPTEIDYSKLLGFDMVTDEVAEGVDFRNPTVGAKLGAKLGVTTKTFGPMPIPLDVAGPGAPVMRGLGGRKITSS